MKKIVACWMLIFVMVFEVNAEKDSMLKLWYEHPAKQWVEALPIGNGRLGAIVFGDPANEIIQLNENTLWAGGPNRNDNPNARASLTEVRKLMFEGTYKEAQDLVNKDFLTKTSHGMPYQTVGNLKLTFPGHESYTNYYRELTLEKAVTTSRYELNGVKYQTSVFSSFPHQVIVMQIKADKPGSITFSAAM